MIIRYHNARVFTGEDAFCTSFVVDDGVFLTTGSDDETARVYPEAASVDLGGCFVCPGFNDSHMHLLSLGSLLGMAQLAPCSDSLEHVLCAIADFALLHPDHPFILGRGWNQDFFSGEKRFPTRDDLDSVCSDRPCMITRACGHVAVANSAALCLAGIGDAAPCVDGGKVETDAAGRPTGVLSENAISLVSSLIPKPDRAAIKERLQLAMTYVAKMGITSVQSDDFSSADVPFEEIIAAYQELKAEGKLTVRVTEQCLLPDAASLKRFLSAGYRTGWGDDLFRIGPLKLLVDGSLGARTALLRAPYNDAPDACGIATYTAEALNNLVLRAHSAGMQIAIHAIGDGASDLVLDAFDYAQSVCPRKDARHGIVHAQVLNHEQAARMKKLGLHAYIQSIFLDYDTQIVHSRLGARADEAYPAASLLRLGVTLSNGSDAPVEMPNALGGIQCAVTRMPFSKPLPSAYLPCEALTVAEAIRSYTACGAYASFEEAKKGLIRPGYAADFIVLGEDPFAVDPSCIHRIPVLSVVLAGKEIL